MYFLNTICREGCSGLPYHGGGAGILPGMGGLGRDAVDYPTMGGGSWHTARHGWPRFTLRTPPAGRPHHLTIPGSAIVRAYYVSSHQCLGAWCDDTDCQYPTVSAREGCYPPHLDQGQVGRAESDSFS